MTGIFSSIGTLPYDHLFVLLIAAIAQVYLVVRVGMLTFSELARYRKRYQSPPNIDLSPPPKPNHPNGPPVA